MLTLCLKIWLVANLLVLGIFMLLSSPHAPGIGLTAFLFSCLFSLPAIGMLYGLLLVLQQLKVTVIVSWITTTLVTAAICAVTFFFFRLVIHDAEDVDFILPLSFVVGFSAMLFFSPQLHSLFQKFQYMRYENN